MLLATATLAGLGWGLVPTASAVTPDSPEVRAVVERALTYLRSNTDRQLGGRCLRGLAYYKSGASLNHPAVQEAILACEQSLGEQAEETRLYSVALAIIFLCEVAPQDHEPLIEKYVGLLQRHQLPAYEGGYGYLSDFLGDTSQTQYAALAAWELLQVGVTPDVGAVEGCVEWILRTQDPEGGWAYKGQIPKATGRQNQGPASCCMTAAGLSIVLIGGDLLGIYQSGSPGAAPLTVVDGDVDSTLPPAMREAGTARRPQPTTLRGTGKIELAQLQSAHQLGRKWIDQHFNVSNDGYYPYYYLYSLERYKSFEELVTGDAVAEPGWYQRGFEYLQKNQQQDGSWPASGECSAPCSTAFSVLFLLRSTRASIKKRLGDGTLVGSRGLPADLSRLQVRHGRLIVARKPTDVDALLEELRTAPAEEIAALEQAPLTFDFSDLDPAARRRLEQAVRSGQPAERLAGVQALGQLRQTSSAPTLIFALSDPDRRIVRAARDALQSISRNFVGYGPPDNFEESQRVAAIAKWKAWYGRAVPDSPLP